MMNKQVHHALDDVDCVWRLSDARGSHDDDDLVVTLIKEAQVPALMALNKHDLVPDKQQLLPRIAEVSSNHPVFEEFYPICARTGAGVDSLLTELSARMPQREHLILSDQITDRSIRFLSAEIIRAKTKS